MVSAVSVEVLISFWGWAIFLWFHQTYIQAWYKSDTFNDSHQRQIQGGTPAVHMA